MWPGKTHAVAFLPKWWLLPGFGHWWQAWLPAAFSVEIQRSVNSALGFFNDGVVGRGGKAKRSLVRTSLFLEVYLIVSLSFFYWAPTIISRLVLRSDSHANALSEELWGSRPLQRHRLLPGARVQEGTRRREQQKGECEHTKPFLPFWFLEMVKEVSFNLWALLPSRNLLVRK